MNISKRMSSIEFSPIRKYNGYAIEAEEKGRKVYHLNIGQPDVKTSECFMESIRSFDREVIAYAESSGDKVLIERIRKYMLMYGMNYDDQDILITAGGSEALNMVFNAILDPDDEVILAEPFYTNYRTFVNMAGGKITSIPTFAEEGYRYAERGKLKKALTEKTKAIVCVNPGNPTGNVLTEEEMEIIIEFARENDLYIIADEVYREFVYDGRKVLSFGQYKEAEENVIIIDSVSKRFSACGARIGCIISKDEQIMESVLKLAQGRLCVSTVDQIGAAELYTLTNNYYNEVRAAYESRRDAVYEEIIKIPGAV